MIRINEHYQKLQNSYLFAEINQRIQAFQQQHPERELIRLGIGDVTQPLPDACVQAMHKAVDHRFTLQRVRHFRVELDAVKTAFVIRHRRNRRGCVTRHHLKSGW